MSTKGIATTLFLALGLTALSCSGSGGPSTSGASDELTAEQCTYFAEGDKVQICHRTGSARKPYTVIRTSVASCGGHAQHDGDYITSTDPLDPLYDPTCSGQGCFPEGAPYDGSVECCDGLSPATGVCADVDECAAATNPCGANATCTNVLHGGGYTCACAPGSARDAAGTCVDINECAGPDGGCGLGATCTNNAGAPPTCTDIDECAGPNNGGCGAAATCTNTPAGAPPTCTHIDACGPPTAPFPSDALWFTVQGGGIYGVTLTRDAAGVPTATGVTPFATPSGGASPGIAFNCGRLHYVSSDGTIIAYAGDRSSSVYASGLPAGFFGSMDLAFNSAGHLFLAVWAPPGLFQLAGGGPGPWSPLPASASLAAPVSMGIDATSGLLFISDFNANRIHSYDPALGVLGDVATVSDPVASLVGCDGQVYVAQHYSGQISKVNPATGSVSPLVTGLYYPEGLTVDAWGHMYVGMNNGVIGRFDTAGQYVPLISTGLDVDRLTWFGGGQMPLVAQACTAL